jgi:hypothetical protein
MSVNSKMCIQNLLRTQWLKDTFFVPGCVCVCVCVRRMTQSQNLLLWQQVHAVEYLIEYLLSSLIQEE